MLRINDDQKIEPKKYQNDETIKELIIPKSVICIGWSAFNNCSNLTDILFLGKTVFIANHAFANCKKLTKVQFPKFVYVGCNAFMNCTALYSIHMDECQKIGSFAFADCYNLSHIVIKTISVKLDNSLFYNSVKIDNLAFYNVGKSVRSYSKFEFPKKYEHVADKIREIGLKVEENNLFLVRLILSSFIPDELVTEIGLLL